MPPKRKKAPRNQRSYRFKLPQDRRRFEWFRALTAQAAEELLEGLWSDDWLTKLGTSKLKAYKVIDEARVQLAGSYLPSRVRRGIAERVGRIIRGQYKRMQCYYDCLQLCRWMGFQTKDRTLTAGVMQHCRKAGRHEEGQNVPPLQESPGRTNERHDQALACPPAGFL